MQPLTIVGWLWRTHKGTSIYTPEHANTWARMIDRNLSMPHRFVLLTDQPEADYDPLITAVPLWDDWRNLRNSVGGEDRPQCYPRLKAFSREAGKILGQRFVSIDLDVIVVGDLDPLFDRDEDFLILRRTPVSRDEAKTTYQGAMWMMTAGAREKVWTDFKGEQSVAAAAAFIGSDQAWIRHALGPDEQGWTEDDGVYCSRNLKHSGKFRDKPPANARIVFFNGGEKPWEFEARNKILPHCAQCGAPVSLDNTEFYWVAKAWGDPCTR